MTKINQKRATEAKLNQVRADQTLSSGAASGITIEDINRCYLRYLGRLPEQGADLSGPFSCANIEDLEAIFANSREHLELISQFDIYHADNLQSFVEAVDALGGWGDPRTSVIIDRFRFHRDPVNEDLDPYSDEYVAEQLRFYETLTGYAPDQNITEITPFNPEEHFHSSNPYAHVSSHVAAMHSCRISHAVKQAELELSARVLDMGCGWGFSSELLAYFGLEVFGIDINQQFCDLVNQRALARNLRVQAVRGSFEEIPTDAIFDAVVYYECLHHAIKPWVALRRSYERLRPGGKLILAGEPVNDMWRNWGIRTDPESLYVIKKFGWFESGWSLDFIKSCIQSVGYESIQATHHDGPIGWVITATK